VEVMECGEVRRANASKVLSNRRETSRRRRGIVAYQVEQKDSVKKNGVTKADTRKACEGREIEESTQERGHVRDLRCDRRFDTARRIWRRIQQRRPLGVRSRPAPKIQT